GAGRSVRCAPGSVSRLPVPGGRIRAEARHAVLPMAAVPHRTAPATGSPASSVPFCASEGCAKLTSLHIQPREDLPDRPEVIRRVSGRGESGGSAHVLPIRTSDDNFSPSFGFVAETVA